MLFATLEHILTHISFSTISIVITIHLITLLVRGLGGLHDSSEKVDSLSLDVDLLKSKVVPHDAMDKTFATANAIQVRIDDNVRMLAELHARWEREDEIARNNKMNVCTITTTSNTETLSANIPPTTNAKIVNEEKPTFSTKKLKTIKPVSDKCAEIFQAKETPTPLHCSSLPN